MIQNITMNNANRNRQTLSISFLQLPELSVDGSSTKSVEEFSLEVVVSISSRTF